MGAIKKVILLSITIFILLTPLSIRTSSGKNDSTPVRIHLSWEGDPRTEITVMWETDESVDSVVEYGLDDSFGSSVQGESIKPAWAAGYIHQVKLSDLKPDTEYYYRCGYSGYWSGVFTFRTAPEDPEDFSFLVIGDSRNPGYNDHDLSRWEMVVQAMQDDLRENEDKYGFLHFLGDNIYEPDQQYVWEKWFDILSIVSREIVFMESIGNHEYDYYTKEPVPNYLEQFAFPGNELWYSYDYSNTHIISLDTESDFSVDSPQYDWLVNDLDQVSEDEKNQWVIVTFHRPPFTSGGNGNREVREYLCPLFDQYGVDLVLCGHMHIYERFYPLNHKGEIVDYNISHYDDPPVPIYVVDGCAGAPQYSSNPKDWTVYMEKEFGYSRISITMSGTLHFEHVQVKNGQRKVVDAFEIEKEQPENSMKDDGRSSNTWVVGVIGILVAVVIIVSIIFFVVRRAGRA